jgi:hypothetical protein
MYVITDENMNNDGLWEIGIKRFGFAYANPELAVLSTPIFERFGHLRIFEASGKKNNLLRFDGEFTLLRETYVPEFTLVQRQWFAIQCALAVYNDPVFVSWANAWIDGTDRSSETAKTVSGKLRAKTHPRAAANTAAAYYAAVHATYAAASITNVAYYVAYAAGTSGAHTAAYAAHAALCAAQANPNINFADIAIAALNSELKEFQEIDF